jgi:hypothetical protein
VLQANAQAFLIKDPKDKPVLKVTELVSKHLLKKMLAHIFEKCKE